MQIRCIRKAYRRYGNTGEAAEALGIDVKTLRFRILYYKITELYQISKVATATIATGKIKDPLKKWKGAN